MKRTVFWIAAIVATTAFIVVISRRNLSIDTIKSSYNNGDLSQTIASIEAHRKKPLNAELLLLAANCYRQLGNTAQFREQIERAQRSIQSKDAVDLAIAMYKIQNGQLDDSPKQMIEVLQNAGAIESDAHSVVIQSAFANDRLTLAKELIDDWRQKSPNSAQMQYLSAVYLNLSGLTEEAIDKWMETIEKYPRHELSWLALSEVFTRPPNVRFQQSELILKRFALQFPNNTEVHFRVAKIQRRLGHALASLSELSSANSQPEILEKANIEFDLGNYRESVTSFEAAKFSNAEDFKRNIDKAFAMSLQGQDEAGKILTDRVTLAATAFAIYGNLETSDSVFDLATDRTARLKRLQDLRAKQALLPRDQSLLREIDSVTSLSVPTPAHLSPHSDPIVDSPGMKLYQAHCANCHGVDGNGFGRAGSNLFPPPRRFRDEPMRMISSKNGVASDTDLAQTIRRGQPGTSMPAFNRFSDSELVSLIEVLRKFVDVGLRQRFADEELHDEGVDGVTESQWVADRSIASEPITLPVIGHNAELIFRGREVFRGAGCSGCHAVPGVDSLLQTRLFDSLGRPLQAPNLGISAFHGSDDPIEIYKRICLGIPGTPHPSLAPTHEGDIESLVAYIVSVRTSTSETVSNYERSKNAVR